MILATDVYYRDGEAIASGVMFDRPKTISLLSIRIIQFDNVLVYKPKANHDPIVPIVGFDLIR